ncbi:hypothetical protein LPJ78_002457 [Coemansia sp. RSA 989]|nr:hypothetical protein LPJ79_004425 [Coemansia sp. RSA 1821]KAJ1865769.1 hypothetical protein LPJ78_002457 [Coemansia sp. RSA 989]KAJ1873689.1 hypothetical protein LPJ55_002140 [Coemansia sp. RSA 990]
MATFTAWIFLLFTSLCWAQVEMREPPPRRSKFSKAYMSSDDVDYNMKSPLGGKIGYPCRNTTAGPIQGTLVAGQDLKVFFDGTATRQGGDCQFAISYDNGTSFAVLWDKLGNCFLDTVNGGYEIPIPDRLPASKEAVFAWTFIPTGGSRSYYMNCADVRVENYGKQEAYTGKELLVVNVPGKPSLVPVSSQNKDSLPELLDKRELITVGEPVQGPETETSSAENEGEATEDDQGEHEDENSGDDGAGGTVVMYVSESTVTTTDVVVVSQFITEDDTDVNALYTFGNGIQTRGQLTTTLGPYAKPLFGSNVGLTVAPDSSETSSSISGMSFTGDLPMASPTDSAKWPSSDYIPPSLPAPQTSSGIDLWPAASHPTDYKIDDSTYPAGTPLFSGTRSPNALNIENTLRPEEDDAHMASILATTNRPSFKSVTDRAQQLSNLPTHAYMPSQPSLHAETKLSTVTRDGKPVLQVVVSMDSSAVPESLTISY